MTPEFIEIHVEFEANTGCWLWSGGRTSDGYGWVSLPSKRCGAHRLSYEVHHGAIPDGLHVLHRCDTPACVNPSHLFVGDRSANMKDAARKGRIRYRSQAGEDHNRAKLTAEAVRDIRQRFERRGRYSNSRALANEYEVSTGTIRQVVSGARWSSVAQERCPSAQNSAGGEG